MVDTFLNYLIVSSPLSLHFSPHFFHIFTFISQVSIYFPPSLQQYLMGSETSTSQLQPEPQQYPQPEDDYFILEPLNNMQLTHPRKPTYYYITHHSPSSIQTLLQQFRQHFKIDHFPEIRTLKQEMSFIGPNQLVKVIAQVGMAASDMEYLQNERKIYQIILIGQAENSIFLARKIVKVIPHQGQLLSALKELQTKDVLQVPSSSILLVDQDTKLLNKYRLNFHCATQYANRYQAKQDFITLARHLFPHRAPQINKFQQQYNLSLTGKQRVNMVLNWAFRDTFYWKLVDEVTRNTTDPKRMAYVRLALKDLHEVITYQWRKKTIYQYMYIVIDLTEEQHRKLAQTNGRYLLFTSFVKGYTNQQQANAQLKTRPFSFKFTVVGNRKKLQPNLDFGFVTVNQSHLPDVIFNIYNVFLITAITTNNRRGQLIYGMLASNFVQRQNEKERKTMTQKGLDLVRNYDYIEDMMGKIDGQATLLQLSGYLKESLELYDRKVQKLKKSIRESNSNENNDNNYNNRSTLLQEEEIGRCAILKADALRRSGQFQNAEKQYRSVQAQPMRVVALVHLAELYLHRGQEPKFDKIIQELAIGVQALKGLREQYFKARNLLAIRLIKQCKYSQAISSLNTLKKDVTQISPFSIQGKPIIHDIYRCLATCKSKQKDYIGAIHILKDTLGWQLACEGKTPNVALTQTLIQSVSRSSNSNHEELERSVERVKEMQSEFQKEESNALELAVGNDLIRSLLRTDIVTNNEIISTSSSMSSQSHQEQSMKQSTVMIDMDETLIKTQTS